MENELTVKNVGFCGAELLAVQQKDNGKIYVGINSILRELGFDERQIEYRRNKWNSDKVLYKGVQKFSYPSKDGGIQETYCIEIKRLPLALAKIDITPKMESDMPDLAEKLEKYQDECADVLAEAFLPKRHNVQRLTVTSRDIAVMIGDRKKHSVVLREIRECITELEDMGFDISEFFTESTYLGANNQDGRPQYLCTERGCERFSWRLEPEERKIFIREFTDRFERMRAVLEGRPVKGVEFNEESQTVIRLYENNDWGILLMDNEVYNLTPKEIKMISKVIPILKKKGVEDIKRVLCAFLESMDRDGKLEELASWGVDKVEEVKDTDLQTLLPPPQIDLNQVVNLTVKQAQQRYGMGRAKILEAADRAGATMKNGGRFYFNRKVMDEYFQNQIY